MNTNTTKFNAFKTAFFTIDWCAESCAHNPDVLQNGRTSIAHAADCYVALSPGELATAKKMIRKHFPQGWKGWPIAVKSAQRRRDAFLQAIAIGTFSNNPQVKNYAGNYFYSHRDKGIDYFKNRWTYLYVTSPFSKRQLDKHMATRGFGFFRTTAPENPVRF